MNCVLVVVEKSTSNVVENNYKIEHLEEFDKNKKTL